MKKKKVLLTTIGTLGDLNPLIALAKALEESEVEVHIAACEAYSSNVERENIRFRSVRPFYDPKSDELCDAILHPLKTLPYFYRNILAKENLDFAIADFDSMIKEYDLVIGNVFSYGAKISCLKNNVKWVSINLSPTCFFSKFDPPSLYPINIFNHLKIGRSLFFSLVYRTIFKLVDIWGRDIHRTYKALGIRRAGNLLRTAPFSEVLNLAMYSNVLGSSQRDWPSKTVQTGFLYYSAKSNKDLSDLDNFIQSHDEAPILFTFGSTALISFEDHYEMILDVADRISQKYKTPVILTLDKETIEKYKHKLSDSVYLCDYIPYTDYMDKMKLIIHQGGIGTVSPCLKSGVPQIILPGCTDQFDNAYRIERIKIGKGLPLKKLSAKKLEETICELLDNPQYVIAAKQIQAELEKEDARAIIVKELRQILSAT